VVKGARVLLTWGTKGDRPGDLYSPIGIAINARDDVYLTELNNPRPHQGHAHGVPRRDPPAN
jgi:hypothetical protein